MKPNIILSFGAGNMAKALILPILELKETKGLFYSPSGKSANELASLSSSDTLDCLGEIPFADYYFISCKPQNLSSLAKDIRGKLDPKGIVVSILAGVDLETLKKELGHNRVIRLMPSTPSFIKAGITLFLKSSEVEEEKATKLIEFLKSVGVVYENSNEEQFDRMTGYTGSGPAYIFEFANLMAKDLSRYDVSLEESQELMKDLFLGSAKMLKESDEDAQTLRERVACKGGVTFETLESFKNDGWEQIIRRGLEANYQKTKELNDQMKKDKTT